MSLRWWQLQQNLHFYEFFSWFESDKVKNYMYKLTRATASKFVKLEMENANVLYIVPFDISLIILFLLTPQNRYLCCSGEESSGDKGVC